MSCIYFPGVFCFACNPIVDYVSFKDGSITMEDLLEDELSSYNKGKGLCKEFQKLNDQQRNSSKFVAECASGKVKS